MNRLTNKEKQIINKAVKRVVKEYGETIRLLGKDYTMGDLIVAIKNKCRECSPECNCGIEDCPLYEFDKKPKK